MITRGSILSVEWSSCRERGRLVGVGRGCGIVIIYTIKLNCMYLGIGLVYININIFINYEN